MVSKWRLKRDAIARPVDSRQFVDDILGQLAASRFGPGAWGVFFGRSLARSAAQARGRPEAATEVTLLHLPAFALGARRWAVGSWFLAITHLGLLGDRETLGWPNRLTLLRALLPALAPGSKWTSVAALATDFADGPLARRGSETAFGAFADPIADGVFWSWYALRWERNRWLRWVPLTLFGTTTGAIAIAYFAKGRSIDYPRIEAFRFVSGAAEMLLAFRALRST